MDFENPTWNSNWDFEEYTVKFTVSFTTNYIIHNITKKLIQKTNKNKLNKKQNKKQKQKSNSILIYTKTHCSAAGPAHEPLQRCSGGGLPDTHAALGSVLVYIIDQYIIDYEY